MSELYRLRIDEITGLDTDELLQVCGSVQHVLVRHELPNGNPHFHAYIKTDVKQANLRKKIKTLYPEIQKSDYSLKSCDESRINEYVQYMFNTKHGNTWELYHTLNFDNTVLNDLIKAAQEISTDFEQTTKYKKNTGPTIWDIAMEVEEIVNKQLTEEHPKYEVNYDEYQWERYRIEVYTDTTILVMRKHKKAFCDFVLRKVISTAMSSTDKGKVILRKKMFNHFYSN